MPVLSSLESIYTSSDASKHSQVDRLQSMILKGPTDTHVFEISGMTHNEDDRKEIQKIIYQRLRPAATCMPHEIYHVLVLIQKCLPIASPDFKKFCVGLSHLVEELEKWSPSGNHYEPQITANICDAAHSLRKTINDISRPESQVQTRASPFPTPPSSPETIIRSSPSGRFRMGGPPGNTRTELGGDVKHPSQILNLGKEQVAKMTFESQHLKHILKRLDARLDLKFSDGKTTEEIIQALTLVHHCFLWGSSEFVDHYRVKKATFNILHQHRNSQVRSHAKPIVSLLDDQSLLKRERKARAAMSASQTA